MSQHMVDGSLPEDIRQELATNYLRVQNPNQAKRLWTRLLTEAERNRLGDDLEPAYREGGTVGMWMRLHEVTAARAVIDLAKLFHSIDEVTESWLLRGTGEFSDDPEEALRIALKQADLVLTEDPRAVFWMGAEIDVDWHKNRAIWEYFVTLCEHAKQDRAVDAADFGDRRKPDNHIKLKSRLTTKFPGFPLDLGNLIVADSGGRQRLDISPDRIRIIQAPSSVP